MAVAELIVRIAALALEVYSCILVAHQSCQQARQLRSFCVPNGLPLVIHVSICVPKTFRSMKLIHSILFAISPTESESRSLLSKISQSSKSFTPTKLLFHLNPSLHHFAVVVGSSRRIRKGNALMIRQVVMVNCRSCSYHATSVKLLIKAKLAKIRKT